MSFTGLLDRTVTLQRQTTEMLALRTIAADMAPSLTAGATCCAFVVISGADTTGTVTVIGPVAGVSTSEVLTFAGDLFKQTINQWDSGALTAVKTSGLTGNIKVDARAFDGSPVIVWGNIATGVKVRIDAGPTKLKVGNAGQDSTIAATMFMAPLAQTLLQGGDRVVDSGSNYRIMPSHWLTDGLTIHHYEVPLSRETRN